MQTFKSKKLPKSEKCPRELKLLLLLDYGWYEWNDSNDNNNKLIMLL